MRAVNDVEALEAHIHNGYARHGRNIAMFRDVRTASVSLYDLDYEIELGRLNMSGLGLASRSTVERLVREACREPTSLEILYYAQVGGPHAMSYARLGPRSDVDVFGGMDGRFYCHHCVRGLGDSTGLGALAMVRHLRAHLAAGDKVPETVIPAIKADAPSQWVLRHRKRWS